MRPLGHSRPLKVPFYILWTIAVWLLTSPVLAWDLWMVTSQDFSDGVDHDRFRILVVRNLYDPEVARSQEFIANYEPVPGTMDYYGYKNALGDIAFAPDGNLYGVSVTLGENSGLYRLDRSGDPYSLNYLGDFPFQWGSSLYFDPRNGRGYTGGGLESWQPYEWSHGFYVFNNYDPSTTVLWRDMRSDYPQGGTVMGYAHHGGYLYTFWGPGHWDQHTTYLLRITEDSSGNFVDYINLGDVESKGLPEGAWDIISDGVYLYALYPYALYRIENYQGNGTVRYVKVFDFNLQDDEAVNGITAKWADLEIELQARPTTNSFISGFDLIVTLRNRGPYPAERVKVYVAIPDGVTLSDQNSSQGFYDSATKTWDVGTLDVDDSAELVLALSSSSSGPFTFKAWVVHSSALDPDSSAVGDMNIDDWEDGIADDDEASLSLALISGYIFEDIDSDLLANSQVVGDNKNPIFQSAEVYLFKDNGDGVANSNDLLVAKALTNNDGKYLFPASWGSVYWVAVNSKTLRSIAGFNSNYGIGDVWADQTYGPRNSFCANPEGYWGSMDPFLRPDAGPCFGGKKGALSDRMPANMAIGDPLPSTAEHIAKVSLGSSGAANINFGFSFNVVTNINDHRVEPDLASSRTCQGCLRQFIQNANALKGKNAMRFVPTVSTNDGAGGDTWWRVDLSLQANASDDESLPAIRDNYTILDGTAYRYDDGTTLRDTNSSTRSAPSTVGVSGTTLDPFKGPEL